MLETKLLAGPGKGSGPIARAVVGHDTLDRHAQARIVSDRRLEEGNRAGLPLILHHPAEGDPGGVVDADMDELPADPASIALTGPITGDAMADSIEFAELFDVDMDEFAGMFALIAPHRLSRFQITHPIQSQVPENTANSGRGDAHFGCDLLAGVALSAQSLDCGACGGRRLARQ